MAMSVKPFTLLSRIKITFIDHIKDDRIMKQIIVPINVVIHQQSLKVNALGVAA